MLAARCLPSSKLRAESTIVAVVAGESDARRLSCAVHEGRALLAETYITVHHVSDLRCLNSVFHHLHLSSSPARSPNYTSPCQSTMAGDNLDTLATLNDEQQLALQQYASVTNQEPKAALPLLKRCEWNVSVRGSP